MAPVGTRPGALREAKRAHIAATRRGDATRLEGAQIACSPRGHPGMPAKGVVEEGEAFRQSQISLQKRYNAELRDCSATRRAGRWSEGNRRRWEGQGEERHEQGEHQGNDDASGSSTSSVQDAAGECLAVGGHMELPLPGASDLYRQAHR